MAIYFLLVFLFERLATIGANHFEDEEPCNASLVVAVSGTGFNELTRVDLRTYYMFRFTPNVFLPEATAVAADQESGSVFFTDLSLSVIMKTTFKNSIGTTTLKELGQGSSPTGIAADPVYKNIYYTDSNKNLIARLNYEGQGYTELISGIDTPRSIALKPAARTIYFSSWGVVPKISKASYSGNDIELLLKTHLAKPSGLTIDLEENKLYWCDSELDTVSSMYVDGSGRQTIYQRGDNYDDLMFVDLSLYHHLILVSDWITREIYMLERTPTRDLFPLLSVTRAGIAEPGRPYGTVSICVPVNASLAPDRTTEPTKKTVISSETALTSTPFPSSLRAVTSIETPQTTLSSTVIPDSAPQSVSHFQAPSTEITNVPTPVSTSRPSETPYGKNSRQEKGTQNDGISQSTVLVIGIGIGGALIFSIIIAFTVCYCTKVWRTNNLTHLNRPQGNVIAHEQASSSPPPYSVYMHKENRTGMLAATHKEPEDDMGEENGTYIHPIPRAKHESEVYLSIVLED